MIKYEFDKFKPIILDITFIIENNLPINLTEKLPDHVERLNVPNKKESHRSDYSTYEFIDAIYNYCK